MKEIIGRRIMEERVRQNLTQPQLIARAQLDMDRQSLGQIEKGEREVKAWELAKISRALNVEMVDFFPKESPLEKPFVLWREKPENHVQLEAEFLRMCKDYKLVEDLNRVDANEFRKLPNKEINITSFSYSDAYALAEEVRDELSLGDYPAISLVKILEEKYGIKFFFNSLDGNGSAASSVSTHGHCILVSSNEPSWRQSFSIAHELFHIIAWNPSLLEQVRSDRILWDKNEKLANAFAAGLLVPREALQREIRSLSKEEKLNNAGIVAIALQFNVSLEALLWRMASLFLIPKDVVHQAKNNEDIRALDRSSRVEKLTPHVSHRFIRLAYMAFENGEISQARLAKMLNQPLSDLLSYLRQFGLAKVDNYEFQLSHP